MTTSLTTSNARGLSRIVRDLQLGQFTTFTAKTIPCPVAEPSSEIHKFIYYQRRHGKYNNETLNKYSYYRWRVRGYILVK
jgi:hypothetical protein